MRLAVAFLAVTGAMWSGGASAQDVPGCGNLRNAFGPYDYRVPENKRNHLPIVDNNHFTAEVESLERGISGSLIQDIDYTLRAFPNHHRALNAVARYALQGNRQWANKNVITADCYFQRALALAPDDEVVHMLFGSYLAKRGNNVEAVAEFEKALQLAPESIEIHYNIGLLYLNLGNLDAARKHAEIAYAGGHPLPGLRDRIAAEEAKRRSTDAGKVRPSMTE